MDKILYIEHSYTDLRNDLNQDSLYINQELVDEKTYETDWLISCLLDGAESVQDSGNILGDNYIEKQWWEIKLGTDQNDQWWIERLRGHPGVRVFPVKAGEGHLMSRQLEFKFKE